MHHRTLCTGLYVSIILSRRVLSTLQRVSPATLVAVNRHQVVNISRNAPAIFIGSCFSVNMADALKKRKFNVFINPQGVQFNPVSIASTLSNCIHNRLWTQTDVLPLSSSKPSVTDEYIPVCSFQHHSSYTVLNKDVDSLLERMNRETSAVHNALLETRAVLFLTLGTTKIYNHISYNIIVSNCHGRPGKEFKASALSPAEIYHTLHQACEDAMDINQSLQIVLTVSPVRHTRDGVVENSKSKAALLAAVSDLCDRFPDRVSYFPAYEIMMDELRDYRWYHADMVHPSEAAVDYIFEILQNTYMDDATIHLSNDIMKLLQDIDHRPALPNSPAYKAHLQRVLARIETLIKGTPDVVSNNLDKLLDEQYKDIKQRLGRFLY